MHDTRWLVLDWLGFSCGGLCSTYVSALDCFVDTDPSEQDDADGAHDEELQGVPDEQDHEDIQPSGSAVFDEVGADARSEEVGAGEEHRGDTPLEASPGADCVEESVRRHVAAQEIAGVDACCPEQSDHNVGLSHRTTMLTRQCVESGPKACPEGRHIKEESASLSTVRRGADR